MVRIFSGDEADDRAAEPAPVQDPELRRLVDLLPEKHRHILERVYFGGVFLSVAARELGLDKRAARTVKEEALAMLREWMTEGPPEADPDRVEDPDLCVILVGLCQTETEWGQCQQPALEGGLCAAHLEWIEGGVSPDTSYHQAVVEGRREPIQARLEQSEMDALVYGRYRGDGRRLDAYTTYDPLTGLVDL